MSLFDQVKNMSGTSGLPFDHGWAHGAYVYLRRAVILTSITVSMYIVMMLIVLHTWMSLTLMVLILIGAMASLWSWQHHSRA